MYVSNENPTLVDVYFDDVKMSYTPSNILQSNEYYPYGLQTVNSWTRASATGNNFLANAGTELNTTSQLYALEFRNYDPILGRLHQVDPMADKYASLSPYHYSFNNPATFTDANGADVLWGLYTREEFARANMGRDQAWSHGGATGDLSPEAMAESVHSPSVGKWYRVSTVWQVESGYRDANNNFIHDQYYYSYNVVDTRMEYVEGEIQTGWFDDPQGEFFFNHWRNGNGQELHLNSVEWHNYMKKNDYLATVSIATHLYGLNIKNSGWIKGSFHGETGKSDWSSGYGMLNGSNARVGDLEYFGYAYVHDTGSVSYLLSFTWNDIMDPNAAYLGDIIGAALFSGTPYNVHISWTDLIHIEPNK
ncbi:MAG: hypothetical protein HOP30_15895 [Cyclobacteriaceae bacterium]|nr:hypothetical protein [Cyclobacteriaceae bacterium]